MPSLLGVNLAFFRGRKFLFFFHFFFRYSNPGIRHSVMNNIELIPNRAAIRCRSEAHAISVFDGKLRDGKVKRVEFIMNEIPISFDKWYGGEP